MRALSKFVTRQAKGIVFVTLALCAAGAFAAATMPTSVFPQTDFPRVVVLVDNGVMPADQMMAEVTRPIEEAMNDIIGVTSIRSATSRGSAEINVFFNWRVDMQQQLLAVQGRLSQLASQLPSTAALRTYRLTFSAFPVIGLSMTSKSRDTTALWTLARYTVQPQLTRLPGVASVQVVGGQAPEWHVVVDPYKLEAASLSLQEVVDALGATNVVDSAGMMEGNHELYLTLVTGLVHTPEEIGQTVLKVGENRASVTVADVGRVEAGVEPVFRRVTADGVDAVLLNVRSQPDASTVDVERAINEKLALLRAELPPDVQVAFFYDQALLVEDSIRGVWECILIGLVLSVAILFLFLRNWGTTIVAVVVIPVTVLVTLVAMRLFGLSFNLMTLGGIAAAIGLVIDDAIVVVENIYVKIVSGLERRAAIEAAVAEITAPIVGSTLTPVVVFLPLTFLDGLPGVFFRALALTMVVALLTSLVLALTLTPTLALRFVGRKAKGPQGAEGGEPPSHADHETGGRFFGRAVAFYEVVLRRAIARPWLTVVASIGVMAGGVLLYQFVESGFMPEQDEGAFVLDYRMPPGTSLSETNRVLTHVEEMLRETPEIESYSRRTGARLALAIAEPNTGDFLVKLKTKRDRSVWEVTDELREKVESSEPAIEVEFAGILNDLIGDLVWSPAPIEIKVFSNDPKVLQTKAEEVAALIEKVDGVVDVFDGVVITGPALTVTVDRQKAAQAGLTVADVTKAANTALLGQVASSVLQGDRKVDIRVLLDPRYHQSPEDVGSVLLHSSAGGAVRLADIATIGVESGQTELRREDTRQNVAVEARLSGRDLGSAIAEIQGKVSKQISLPPGTTIEYGGLYHEQQESFRNLMFVLLMAILLVFTVLVLEFRSFIHPVAIVWGSVLSLFGVLAALLLTGTAFNIISFLGAIITIGIVAKNGILMLDFVDHLEAEGHPLLESVVISGRRRIRPVVMTSLAAALGMLPLAFGLGSGAEMLKPLAIAVIGGLAISVLFSLVATPTVFYLLRLLAAPRLEGDEWPESSDARGPLDPLPSPSGMARSPLPGTLAPEGEAS